MNNKKNYKTILIRMDKIGDLVVSLNASEHPLIKTSPHLWVISKGLGWVLEHSPYRNNFMESDKSFSIISFFQLVKALKSSGADTAVVFQAPWFVGLALMVARIPNRVGRLSQWHSYLFFNKGVRQKRSLAEKHESNYNWEMISEGLTDSKGFLALEFPKLSPPDDISSDFGLPEEPYCVVHPGMMGSALNWPLENYATLVTDLSKKLPVVITGTESDRPWTNPLMSQLNSERNIFWLQEKMNPKQLLKTLSAAKFVVAPSTGIIHLASALGTPVVGFYSPRQSERVSRWGPLNQRALLFSPPLESSESPECMGLIKSQNVFDKISKEFLL